MDYGICVIGAGTGGYVAALRAAQLGAKVLLVEKRTWAEFVSTGAAFRQKPC